ncbi:LapA family protein [Desulfosporosinus fructosivorans]
MRIWFIFSLFFSVLVAIFAVLNSNVVLIKLYWVDYQLSQSLVILFSAVLGGLITSFLGIFSKIRSTLKIRELNFAVKSLEQKIIELNNQNTVPKISDSTISNDSESETNNKSIDKVY